MEMIGDHCFITRVLSGSDAEKKGLKPENEVLAVNQHPVSRKTISRILYIYDVLRPQPGLLLTLADETDHPRQLEVMAKFSTFTVIKYLLHQGVNQRVRDQDALQHSLRARYFEKRDDLLVVKIPEFAFSAEETDNIIGDMRKHRV